MSKKKRLGKVRFAIEYVVDLDDDAMVDEATDCIAEDIMNAVKHNEVDAYIKITDPDPSLKESDIPSFLTETDEEVA